MKINPDDPVSKMSIRLYLANDQMQGLIASADDQEWNNAILTNTAFELADAMIEQANREEGKQPG